MPINICCVWLGTWSPAWKAIENLQQRAGNYRGCQWLILNEAIQRTQIAYVL